MELALPYPSTENEMQQLIQEMTIDLKKKISSILLHAKDRWYITDDKGNITLDDQGNPLKYFKKNKPKVLISKPSCPRCWKNNCQDRGNCDGNWKKHKFVCPNCKNSNCKYRGNCDWQWRAINKTQFPGASEPASGNRYRRQDIFN